MKVVVVTNTELGWDCIVGVFSSLELAVEVVGEKGETQDELESISYFFHETKVNEGEYL